MGLQGLPWCDFAQWTPTGTNIRRIPFDREYWSSDLRPALLDFYFDMFLPNLFMKEDGLLAEAEVTPGALLREMCPTSVRPGSHKLESGCTVQLARPRRLWLVNRGQRAQVWTERPGASSPPWGHLSALEAPPPRPRGGIAP